MSVFKSKRIDLKLLKVNLQGFSRFCLQRGMTDLEQQLTFKSHLFFHSLHLFSFLSPAHHHLYNIFGNMPLGNRNLASPTLPSYSLLAHQRDFLALFPQWLQCIHVQLLCVRDTTEKYALKILSKKKSPN